MNDDEPAEIIPRLKPLPGGLDWSIRPRHRLKFALRSCRPKNEGVEYEPRRDAKPNPTEKDS
jgi:hypothetical protein